MREALREALVIEAHPLRKLRWERNLAQLACTRVIFAQSGKSAVRILGEKAIPVVFSPWDAQDLAGLELLRDLQRWKHHPRPKVIFLRQGMSPLEAVAAVKGGAFLTPDNSPEALGPFFAEV